MRRIGIIGGGRFGSSLAQALAERGVEVLLLDRDRNVVDHMAGIVAKAMEGDATEEGTLEAAGFRDCDMAVVAVSSDMECSIMATLALKEMKIPFIIAKAASDMQGKVLSRVGADRIVPDKDMAARLAHHLVGADYVEVAEGINPEGAPAGGRKTLAESAARLRYRAGLAARRMIPRKSSVPMPMTSSSWAPW